MTLLDGILRADGAADLAADELARAQARRLAAILDACTPRQRAFVLDPASYKALRCPRRAGKSWALTAAAAHMGESRPGSRILIISLTLKSTKENYWTGAPSGLDALNRRLGLGLTYNHTDLVWWHQNGSRGRLAGAETKADIEYLRGAAAEADLVLIDEGKSFAPALLQELVRDVLEPGLMTRDGVLVMAGTPGLIPQGPFYEATCEKSALTWKDESGAEQKTPTCVRYALTSPAGEARQAEHSALNREGAGSTPAAGTEVLAQEPWSLHCWTIKDNTEELAARAKTEDERRRYLKTWGRALRAKDKNKWADDHPTWRREYLGEWVEDATGLVYAYAGLKATGRGGRVSWLPEVTRANPTGLPPDDGPWHILMGVDFGYEDDFAVVMAGYSERLAELRVFAEYKSPHLTVEAMADKIREMCGRYGMPESIVGDAGGLGKLVIESLNQTYAIPIVKAEKVEKFDHIELLNSDFHAGKVKVIPDPAVDSLETELCGLQWDLSRGDKAELVRTHKLRESPACPNHLCDALLYMWRFSYHMWARPVDPEPEPGTPAAVQAALRARELARAARGPNGGSRGFTTDGLPGSTR